MIRPHRTLPLVALLAGCPWSSPPDHADAEAFVAQAVPAVLGRRARSHDEVEALATLASVNGPAAVLAVLYEEPEFASYWSLVFANALQIDRHGGSGHDPACYAEPMVPASLYADLAVHVAEADPTEPFCVPPATIVANPGPVIVMYGEEAFTRMTGMSAEEVLADDRHLREREVRYVEHDRSIRYAREDLVALSGVDIVAAERVGASIAEAEKGSRAEVWVDPKRPAAEHDLDGWALAADFVPKSPGFRTRPREWAVVDDTVCFPFNMTDLLAASVQEDRLDALYRGFMGPLATFSTDVVATGKFATTYLQRDPGCMGCHAGTYSTTNARPDNGDWDRFFPALPLDLDQGAFNHVGAHGQHAHRGMGGTALADQLTAFWDASNREAGGFAPFGMDATCVAAGGADGFVAARTDGGLAAGLGIPEVSADAGVVALMNSLRDGRASLPFADVVPAIDTVGSPDDAVPTEDAIAGCLGCHVDVDPSDVEGSVPPADLVAHTADLTPERIYDIVMHGSPAGGMAGGMFTEEEARLATAYLVNHPSHRTTQVFEDGAASFAKLVSHSVVDQVVEEVAGHGLLLEHGAPRSAAAAHTLQWMSLVLDSNDWSLTSVLDQALASDHVNRHAPAESGAGAYDLPTVVYPWAMVAPEAEVVPAGSDANGQGDLVHRWSADSLLHQASAALGWPMPQVYNGGDYPSAELRRAIGGFHTPVSPGVREPTLSVLLAWEQGLGVCAKPPGVDVDVIDAFVDPDAGLTLEQAMLAVKDRLVGDPQWWTGAKPIREDAMAEALLADGLTLDDPASEDEAAVRAYCGALLRSPQFLLAGLPPWEDGANPDPLDGIPCVDDLCSATAYCEHYRGVAADLGYDGTYACP